MLHRSRAGVEYLPPEIKNRQPCGGAIFDFLITARLLQNRFHNGDYQIWRKQPTMNIMSRIDAINAEIDALSRDMAGLSAADLEERSARLNSLRAELYSLLAELKAAQRPH
ncbi:hypothetical protein [Chelatococcus sp. YT9]|uniref:hypothetical protein n=1 Tax=Chelatococcus sp. YT9 TaxID=2835635 RepID=UPI001BCAD62B|nr:hypothetical protein [Chelatococcus sp. YT9]MBS7701660.1 hypothetical protein [Chelatococcus sp. YT9]